MGLPQGTSYHLDGLCHEFHGGALAQLAILMPAAPFWEGEDDFDFVRHGAPHRCHRAATAFFVGSFSQCLCHTLNEAGFGGKNCFTSCHHFYLVGGADSMIFFPVAWRFDACR